METEKRAGLRPEAQLGFMRTLMETIPSPVFYKDASGRYTGCNRAFEEFFGRPREQILGRTDYDLAPREIADEYQARDQELFDHPGTQSYEWVVRTPEGDRQVLFSKATLVSAEGQVLGLIGVIVDLTARKRAEQGLQRARQREEALGRGRDRLLGLRHLSEIPGLGVWWLEELRGLGIPVYRFSVELPGAQEGYFRDLHLRLSGATPSADIPLADYPWVAEVWQRGQPVVVDRRRLDQVNFPVDIQGLLEVPLPGGGSLGVSSKVAGVFDEEAIRTVRLFAGLLAEGLQRLHEFETLYQEEQDTRVDLALERVRSAILQMHSEEDWSKVTHAFDQEMRALIQYDGCGINIVDRSRFCYTTYVVNPGELYDGFQDFLPRALLQAVDTGQPVYRRTRAEMAHFGDNIGPEVNSVIDVPFLGGTLALNDRCEAAFSERDIQVLEQFAQVMSTAHRRLEDLKALALREQQLRQIQRLEAIGQLAAGMSHEINNPLTAVLGYAELLLTEDLCPRIREELETILQQGKRISQLVDRLANFANRQKLQRQPVDLNALVGETVDLMRQRLTMDDIALVEELGAGLPRVVAHPGQVQQVILHLLQNAQEAILRDGKRGQVQVRTRARDGWLRLEIEDDGPGIPAELRERVFDPFFTTKEPGLGPGLGLSLSYRMIQEHQGRIWIEPRAPGTCVMVELPLGGGVPTSPSQPARR